MIPKDWGYPIDGGSNFMRLEQLVHIVEVAQSKSISLAAERTYLSQPAISSSIAKLELELGVELFKRNNQGMFPTEIGELVINKAMNILDQIEDIKEIAKTNAVELTGDIKIAVEPSFCNTLMVNILTSFKYKHPKVDVMLKEGESNNILHDILSGKADIGIIIKSDGLLQFHDVVVKELLSDDLMVLAGRKSVLDGKKNILLTDVLEQPVVLYNTEYETECVISQILKKYGDFKVAYRCDNLNIIEEVVASGNSIAFVPAFMKDYYVGLDTIVTLPLKGLEITIAMIWTKRHRVSMIEKEFMGTIKALCSICKLIS